ncbi:MAG TPA: SDR family NAD(P)-dependent oxidoreductase [Solirubrobacteraceae bacterium]|jgi:NAD(P)-dependent dehydrogenase (short-subunit alcohol dehydrogenase family)|nr:SDR family NAD(P)-dependent oxidoreductase [Solirubrobacteraceae bacterium]
MTRVLITGSADGLGQLSARQLIAGGHEVVLHARSEDRGRDALTGAPGAAGVLAGDLSSIAQTRRLADAANATGRFDAVIHNAGVGYRAPRRIETEDGLCQVFAVNVLAPYLLTALMTRPDRLVYLTSGLHRQGNPDLSDLQWRDRPWNGTQAYCDSKLFDVVLAFAVARLWPRVFSNAVEPGWVATKMGGPGAPDDLELGADTQAWLAVSDDPEAKVSGRVLHHRRPTAAHPAASRQDVQDGLLDACRELSGLELAA